MLLANRTTGFIARRLVAALLITMSPAIAQAPDDCRVAIIIGNAMYPTAPLANPANDARSMATALRKAGFEVFEARDAGKAQMEELIARAGAALKGRHGIGMLYYAGHGIQLDWHDYLVPVDARLRGRADVPGQTVDLQEVIDVFRSSGNRTNILVLDACRDSPFAADSTGKGLAPIDAPPGTFLAYATAPGNVADDGDPSSDNGLYTSYLVRELGVEGAKIEDVFKRVRYQVRRKSEGRQVPWESTSLEDDFYVGSTASAKQPADREKAFAAERIEWEEIKDATVPEPLYAYLQRFPNGFASEQVQFRLDRLQVPIVQAQLRDETTRALQSGVNRYVTGDELVFEVADGFTGLSRRHTSTVTYADNDRVVINDGSEVWDQMGGILKNLSGVKNPLIVKSPADIAIGKSWHNGFTNTTPGGDTSDNFWDYRVVALDDVTVPAGSFKAYRVEGRGEARARNGILTFMTSTHWIDPRTMLVIRSNRLFRSNGKVTLFEDERLASYKPAPR